MRYDGPDLDEVARLTGLSRAEVVAAHTGTPVAGRVRRLRARVRLPGRAATRGCDVPRRDDATHHGAGRCGRPGRRVHAASTRGRSPGGWQLIGRTEAALWDPDRDPPALLAPGDRSGSSTSRARRERRPSRCWPPGRSPRRGRRAPGPGRLGVGRSGAADRAVLRLGEPAGRQRAERRAALEVLARRPRRARPDGRVSPWRSPAPPAPAARRRPPGRPRHPRRAARRRRPRARDADPRAAHLPRGARRHRRAAPCSGRASHDTLSGLGPAPLRTGDVLPVGAPAGAARTSTRPAPVRPPRRRDSCSASCPAPGRAWVRRARTRPGRPARGRPAVDRRSDRVGLRLDGPAAASAPARRRAAERGDGARRDPGPARRASRWSSWPTTR